MMKNGRKNLLAAAAALVLALTLTLTLTAAGCGGTGGIPGGAPATGQTGQPEQAPPTYPTGPMGYGYQEPTGVKNCDTDELLDDFSYLIGYPFTYVPCGEETIRAQKYEDAVTIYLAYEGETDQNLWLYDAKRGTVFFSVGPYNASRPSTYRSAHELTEEEKAQLAQALEEADTHSWDAYCPDEDASEAAYSFALYIEYRGGVFEYHSGSCTADNFPSSFRSIESLFEGYDYADNPLYG